MRAVASCTEAPAAAKEHSTGQEKRAGHPRSVSGVSEATQTRPLSSPSPSAAASLEKLRAEVGSKATGETLKLSRVEAREHVCFRSLRQSSPDAQAVRLRETQLTNVVARAVQRSEAIDKNYPGSVENAVFAIRQGPLRTHSFHLAEPFLRAHAPFLFL